MLGDSTSWGSRKMR